MRLAVREPRTTLRPPVPGASPEHADAGRAAVRVLVVDDERDALVTLVALLSDADYEVRGACRGKEVLDLVRDFAPHAVLLDIGMPDLNGYEVARQIRGRWGELAPLLVAVTGWKQSSDKMLARLAGFDHHVAKPYDPHALLSLLLPLRER